MNIIANWCIANLIAPIDSTYQSKKRYCNLRKCTYCFTKNIQNSSKCFRMGRHDIWWENLKLKSIQDNIGNLVVFINNFFTCGTQVLKHPLVLPLLPPIALYCYLLGQTNLDLISPSTSLLTRLLIRGTSPLAATPPKL